MGHCKKCGNEINENAKFCTSCGAPNTNNKSKKNNLKIIVPLGALILLIAITGGLVFMKINASQKANMKKSIEILNVDIDDYPNIVVSIKATNYEKSLDVKNFTLKENDTFQKDLKLSPGVEENEYKISYKTSDESTKNDRNIKIACLDNNEEEVAEYSYKAPEKTQNSTQAHNSNNVVDTYDHNEVEVKQALDNYEKAYIRMINSKDIYYIRNSIDLSGNLISEFTDLIKSYSDQDISEDLMSYKIEDMKKINESEYQLTVYEKYYIRYGKEKKSSYTDFRTNYVIDKTNSGFQVYSIKDTVKLGSKSNP